MFIAVRRRSAIVATIGLTPVHHHQCTAPAPQQLRILRRSPPSEANAALYAWGPPVVGCDNRLGTVPRAARMNTPAGLLISLLKHNRTMQLTALAGSAARFLVDSDPGRLRLRSAAATTLSLVLAVLALLAFTRATHQPITVAMLGTIVAMQSSAAVKDRHQHSRVVTTLLLFFPAVGATALAAFLSPFGKVADVGFIAVLFAAVWVRRFGPRGNAL
jgi:hypothetical protein